MLAVDTTGLYGLVISPGRVRVDYSVGRRAERVLDSVRVVLPSREAGDTVEPATTSVTLRGARRVLDQVNPDGVRVEVVPGELDGLAPGAERTVPVEVRGVPGLVEAESGVSEVTVTRSDAPSP